MRHWVLAVVAMVGCVTMSFAQEVNMRKEPFMVDVNQLVGYLELNPGQINEVSEINDFFMNQQTESLRSKTGVWEKKMRQAVYGNLKLMKKALDADQYRKYVALINVTNNNNRELKMCSMPDVYLADTK